MRPVMVTMKSVLTGGVNDMPGWDVGVPGLAIYKSRTRQDEDCWNLAHVRSGSCLPGGFMSPEAAVAAAMALGHIDWTQPGSAFQDLEIQREIVAILKEHNFDVHAGTRGQHDLSDVTS